MFMASEGAYFSKKKSNKKTKSGKVVLDCAC